MGIVGRIVLLRSHWYTLKAAAKLYFCALTKMSGFGQADDGFFQADYSGYDQQQTSGYDMGDMPPEQQFGQFDYSGYGQQGGQYPGVSSPQGQYMGSILTPDPAASFTAPGGPEDYENEPPLLEELGLNFDHIVQKTLTVLNPLKHADEMVVQDADLTGPLVFCMGFGGTLLLAGKVHFGYIYGIGVLGCISMYCLMNMMSKVSVSVGCVISILGYCLLPMVILSLVAVLFSLKGTVGMILTVIAVMWCSFSASKLFVTALNMDHQQPLVAYPCALVYGVFALLAVF
ncbi:protein YIPF5 isoform X2 [Lingula anatina]|uniref:Protein YIPF n=1 Tax=Lingula anatina TaxID=7574 RepID=A0A1S3JAV4_LINAN|nr:protein YIPF5 isoform X1 [Lingula anatina]XP_013407326.1 protein YIPF5 isoform X2 [Lingula anatina]|eukprot:XP_013407325.1 protein YIPF5 isoform X1 [Lingula anatina]